MSIRNRFLVVVVIAAAGVVVGCASSEPKSDFSFDIDDNHIRIALSEDVARGFMDELIGADLDCQGDIDDGLHELLADLDRGGPRSRGSLRDGETTISAKRRGGRLDLEITGQGSGGIEATMPWAVAECLLGKPTSIDKAMTSAVKVKVINPDGRNFSFKMD